MRSIGRGFLLWNFKLSLLFIVFILLMASTASASRMVIFFDRSNHIGNKVVDELGNFIKKNRFFFNDIVIKVYDGKGCRGCEVVIAMGNGSEKKRLKSALRVMGSAGSGDGQDGVARSFNHVLSNLKDNSDVVLLLSSGDMCGSDTCSDIKKHKEAKNNENNVKIYAIGLAVPNISEMEQLRCIASSSGGKYFNVSDMTGLKGAFEEIEKIVSYNLEVKVYKAKGSEVSDYMRTQYGYAWWADVYESGTTKKIASTHLFPVRFYLPRGKYDVLVHYGNADKWLKGLKIGNTRRTRKKISFAKGSLVVKVYSGNTEILGTRRVPRLFWWSEVYRAGEKEKIEVTETFPIELNLVVGTYDIKLHYMDKVKFFKSVHIKEGKTVSLKANFKGSD